MDTDASMQGSETQTRAIVTEAVPQCSRERADLPRRLSYVRVQKVGKDGKRRTVFTFLWK